MDSDLQNLLFGPLVQMSDFKRTHQGMLSPNTWGVHLTISAFTNKIRFYGSKNLIFVSFLQCSDNILFY